MMLNVFTYIKAGAKGKGGGQGAKPPYFGGLTLPTSNDPYHQYTT